MRESCKYLRYPQQKHILLERQHLKQLKNPPKTTINRQKQLQLPTKYPRSAKKIKLGRLVPSRSPHVPKT